MRSESCSEDVPFQLVPHSITAHELSIEGEAYAVLEIALRELEPPSGLTAAEQQVVCLVIQGKSNSEIAVERGTSIRTVANQLRSVYAKLKISGRAQLLRVC
jgi:DNA-binding CsgD family transcriptional regulator